MELNVLANIYLDMDDGENKEDALDRLHEILENALEANRASYQIHKVIYD